jgi:hypothetical protein
MKRDVIAEHGMLQKLLQGREVKIDPSSILVGRHNGDDFGRVANNHQIVVVYLLSGDTILVSLSQQISLR